MTESFMTIKITLHIEEYSMVLLLKTTSKALLSGEAGMCPAGLHMLSVCRHREEARNINSAGPTALSLGSGVQGGVGKACALLCSPDSSRNRHNIKEDIEGNDNAVK